MTVFFHNLSPGFHWPTSRSCTFHLIKHAFFTTSFSSFLETCLYHLDPFHSTTVIMSPIPSLSLCQQVTREPICYFNTTYPSNSHPNPRKCHLISLNFLTAMYTTSHSLCYIASLSYEGKHVSRGTKCINLFHPFCTLEMLMQLCRLDSLHSCIKISTYAQHVTQVTEFIH